MLTDRGAAALAGVRPAAKVLNIGKLAGGLLFHVTSRQSDLMMESALYH